MHATQLDLNILPKTWLSDDINCEAISYFGFSNSSVSGNKALEIKRNKSANNIKANRIPYMIILKYLLEKNEESCLFFGFDM